jgi:hypothetical protein
MISQDRAERRSEVLIEGAAAANPLFPPAVSNEALPAAPVY